MSGFVAGGGPFELSGLLDDGGGGLVDGRGTSGRGIAEGICGVNGWGVSRMPLWMTGPPAE